MRVTGSGLGCPDWPLCHGGIIPPLDGPTLIEYSHRLMASVVSLLVIVITLATWRSYRKDRWILVTASLSLCLLVWQVLLGGLTVLMELPAEAILAHLATAEALVAAIVVTYVIARFPLVVGQQRSFGSPRGIPFLLIFCTALLSYGLLLSGSYVTVSGASAACGSHWPLCQGQVLPFSFLSGAHILHRLLAIIAGALAFAVLVTTWRKRQEQRGLAWLSLWIFVLLLLQVFVGAMNLWLGLPMAARALHLSLGTVIWMSLVALAVLAYMHPLPKEGNSRPEPGSLPILERATQ